MTALIYSCVSTCVSTSYCKTGFDSDGLTPTKIATKSIAIVGISYRNDDHHAIYRSCFLVHVIAMV